MAEDPSWLELARWPQTPEEWEALQVAYDVAFAGSYDRLVAGRRS